MPAFDLDVQGVVQGVGFRPFVYRLATRLGLAGWVFNAADGVHIHIEGSRDSCLQFMQAVELEAPFAARIDSLTAHQASVEKHVGFTIRASSATGCTGGLSATGCSGGSDVAECLGGTGATGCLGGSGAAGCSCEPSAAGYSCTSGLGVITQISPDLATCPNCLRELFDPTDRRYGYPFINCTDCGPRFTIIEGLPYDRPLTTMRGFSMCPDCADEYQDPLNRRFHAQPDACFCCGPKLSLYIQGAVQVAHDQEQSQALLQIASAALKSGQIVAIKGLGGYHLACDATSDQAVNLLRQRKHRSNKPLAVMMADLAEVERYCQVNTAEAELLSGSVRPIVLLRYINQAEAVIDDLRPLSPAVAGDLAELGVMLPATPLHHLLFALMDRPLVMTSGNVSDEPIIADPDQAHLLLEGIADLFLDHNRPISSRYDDSVVRVVAGKTQFIRRARGYAPLPLRLPQALPTTLLAVGPEQKNTFCLTNADQAFISQHLGEMDDAAALENWDQTRQLYQRLFQLTPQVLAADLHPEYLTSKWAQKYSRLQGLSLVTVQHHHAHIASVLAEAQVGKEHSQPPAQVIGFAYDGTGLGTDGTIWGGEVLLASLDDFQRLAYLRPVAMPGASSAIREPWRMALAWLQAADLLEHPGAQAFLMSIDSTSRDQLESMIKQDINCPMTSSMGRLFDAVSALLGICQQASYEGEAAIELEAHMAGRIEGAQLGATLPGATQPGATQPGATQPSEARPDQAQRLAAQPIATQLVANQPFTEYHFAFDGQTIDAAPVLQAILDDLVAGTDTALISTLFHQAVVEMTVNVAEYFRQLHGIDAVALSGGVFMNRFLIERLPAALDERGFMTFWNRQLPPNDGCIAYGQAAVAAAQIMMKG